MLKIYKDCGEKLPFILLRELYACFLPETVKTYNSIQLVIHYIVLEDASFTKKESAVWKKFVDKKRTHLDKMDDDQEQINKYFRNQVHHQKLSVLEQAFEVLGIDHYVILENMLKPESFLDYALGGKVDLNGYNPLLNLKWGKKNKTYLNHKLYDEENNPVYPSLLAKKSISSKK